MTVDIIRPSMARGNVRGYIVEPKLNWKTFVCPGVFLPGSWRPLSNVHNDILYEWGAIIQHLLRDSPDGKAYHIGGMYLEFDNSGADVNPVPAVARADSLAYYNGLNDDDADRDYIRVPLTATGASSSDAALYPKNNTALFIAQSTGTVGIHGKTFSDAANSRVYGGALVAFPEQGDDSQDLVFSRFYFPPGQQIPKPASSQIGINWSVVLE